LLVYEFMPNKALDDLQFNRELPVLSWEVRLQIMTHLGFGQRWRD
jgi:hypothetical protein